MPKVKHRKKFGALLQEIAKNVNNHISPDNRESYKQLKKCMQRYAKSGEYSLHCFYECLKDDKIIYRFLTNECRVFQDSSTKYFYISWDDTSPSLPGPWMEKTLENITIPENYEPTDIEEDDLSDSETGEESS